MSRTLRDAARVRSPVLAHAEVSQFRGVTQRASRLCWAACVQARVAMDPRRHSTPLDQADIAFAFAVAPGPVEDLAWLGTKANHPCNQPIAPRHMVGVWREVGYARARWLPLPIAELGAVLHDQLGQDCPVQVRQEGTHAVLVVAYLREANGDEAVFVMDPEPAAPSGWRSLREASRWLDLWIDLRST